ncbi:MAG: hypothetical protein R2875_11585 [Desulfobacterales bacterium]
MGEQEIQPFFASAFNAAIISASVPSSHRAFTSAPLLTSKAHWHSAPFCRHEWSGSLAYWLAVVFIIAFNRGIHVCTLFQ